MNAEFQRIARRDKKAFLSEQCKERKTTELKKTRELSRKLEIPREHFMQNEHNKGNGMVLTEEKDIKRR